MGRTGTREAKLEELSPPALSYVVWWPAFLPECLRGRAACGILGIAQSVQFSPNSLRSRLPDAELYSLGFGASIHDEQERRSSFRCGVASKTGISRGAC